MDKEWLEWRRQGIGASDMSILAAAAGLAERARWMDDPALEAQRIFWDKLGLGFPKKMSDAMRYGVSREEAIRAQVEDEVGWIDVVNLELDAASWVRASLDGLTVDNTIVEIKTLGDEGVALAKEGRVPGYYQAQIAWQLCALHGHPSLWTGKERWVFAVGHYARFDQTAIVRGTAEALAPLAHKLWAVGERFWRRVQERRHPTLPQEITDALIAAEADLAQIARAKSSHGVIKDALCEGIEIAGWHIERTTKTTTSIEWEAIAAELGVDLNTIPTLPPTVSAVFAPWEMTLDEALAASDAQPADAAEVPAIVQAKQQSIDAKASIAGPRGLTLRYQVRRDWRGWAKKQGVAADVIERHTTRRASTSIALVKEEVATA